MGLGDVFVSTHGPYLCPLCDLKTIGILDGEMHAWPSPVGDCRTHKSIRCAQLTQKLRTKQAADQRGSSLREARGWQKSGLCCSLLRSRATPGGLPDKRTLSSTALLRKRFRVFVLLAPHHTCPRALRACLDLVLTNFGF